MNEMESELYRKQELDWKQELDSAKNGNGKTQATPALHIAWLKNRIGNDRTRKSSTLGGTISDWKRNLQEQDKSSTLGGTISDWKRNLQEQDRVRP